AQPELQIEDAAGKLAQKFGAQGDRGLRMGGRQPLGHALARVAVPALEGDPANRRDPGTDRHPFGLGYRSNRRNAKVLGVSERAERGGPSPAGLEAEPA